MITAQLTGLPRSSEAVMMSVRGVMAPLVLCLAAQCAFAQQKTAPRHDDLDVTMQIIVDPDAKLPDEVVRRIPLPAQASSAARDAARSNAAADAAANGQERAREARELGREMSERAKERVQDAAEQREQAQRSMADERRRNPPKPPAPPGGPPRP
jgi:hypothetical protein